MAAWLAGHHQRAGLAGYWQAAATTVTSGGRVLVAPVTLAGRRVGGRPRTSAEPDRWESAAGWYQPGQHAATFVIAAAGQPSVGQPSAGQGLPAAAVRAAFGPPAAQHQVGQQLIMLYRYNLLTRLSGSGQGAGDTDTGSTESGSTKSGSTKSGGTESGGTR